MIDRNNSSATENRHFTDKFDIEFDYEINSYNNISITMNPEAIFRSIYNNKHVSLSHLEILKTHIWLAKMQVTIDCKGSLSDNSAYVIVSFLPINSCDSNMCADSSVAIEEINYNLNNPSVIPAGGKTLKFPCINKKIKQSVQRKQPGLLKSTSQYLTSAIYPLFDNKDNKYGGFDWKPSCVNMIQSLLHMVNSSHSSAITCAEIVSLFLLNKMTPCYSKTANLESDKSIIKINNFESLINIGRLDCYPANGHYQLSCNITANGAHEPINNFSGILDGKGNSISKLQSCLIKHLTGTGVIKNIIFNNADILNAHCSAIVAESAKDFALISSISVENCNARSYWDHATIGLVVHTLSDNACLEYINAKNNYVITTGLNGHGAILALEMFGVAQCSHNTVHNCIVKVEGRYSCPSIIGSMSGNTKCMNNTITDCSVSTGVIAHKAAIFSLTLKDNAKVMNNKAINCTIRAKGRITYSAIGSAITTSNSELSNNEFTNCTVISDHKQSPTGIGVGSQRENSTNSNNIFNHCKVKSNGISSDSAISSGEMQGISRSNNNIYNGCSIETNRSIPSSKWSPTVCRRLALTRIGSLSAFGAGCMTDTTQLNNNSATDCTLISGDRYKTGNIWAGARLKNASTYDNNAINCTDKRPELINTSPSTEAFSTTSVTIVPTPGSESLLLSPLLAAGATTLIGVGITAATTYSYYKAYRQGKTGRDFVLHPFTTSLDTLAKFCNRLKNKENTEEENIALTDMNE